MKASKILIPVVAVLLGLAMGYILFYEDSTEQEKEQSDISHEHEEEQIWTCAMHPQIQRNEPGQCPICGMDLIPMEKSGGNQQLFQMTEEAKKMAQVQTIIIGDSAGRQNGLALSGKIETDETNAASIVSHIPGRIEKLYVRFTGEKIYRGQKIAAIYSPNLITAQKELLEAYKMKDVNPQLYEASLNKLRYWKIKESQIDNIIETQKIKESFDIFADHSGVVLKKNVNVGDHLTEGEVLFTIQNLNQLWGVFEVYERDLQKIEKGQKITYTTPAFPNEKFKSKIEFIDPVIDPQTRTAEVRIAINNSQQKLKPEMFIEGQLEVVRGSEQNNIVVPASAILWTGKRSVVYVRVPDQEMPTYEYREVALGEKVDTYYPVEEGLSVGEEVVVNGNFVIDASAQLANQKSMMQKK